MGTGVVPVQTRGAGVLAQTALGLAELAEGGVLLGVGSSVPAHVKPLETVRTTVRALRANLAEGFPNRPKVIVGGPHSQPGRRLPAAHARPGGSSAANPERDGARRRRRARPGAAGLLGDQSRRPGRRPFRHHGVERGVCRPSGPTQRGSRYSAAT
ncbi:hypothetical protein FAGKG844_640001 [Frankia sp. AgKG'84/4]